MPHTHEDLDDLLCSLEQAYAIFRDFLVMRIGDATLAGDVLREALATTLSKEAETQLPLNEFSIKVLKAAQRSLRDGDRTTRARARRAQDDLPAVLANTRALLRSPESSAAIIEHVVESFSRASQRELLRETFSQLAARDDARIAAPLPRRGTANLLVRANRRLRIAMHQQEIANIAAPARSAMSTIVNIARWPLRRRIDQIVINSAMSSFDVDAWFAEWLQTPDAALNNLRPDEYLKIRAGRERLTDAYLCHLLRYEQDRQQMQRLFVPQAPGEPTRVADAAYFEELRRYARRE